MTSRKSRGGLAALLVAAWVPSAASAQAQSDGSRAEAVPAESGGLSDIIVTARKREESLQDTPLAITALSDAALEARGITSLTDFITAPSPFLQISPHAGSGLLPIIGIRGLATDDPGQGSNESAVGIYMDGVYLGRAQGATMEFGDIARMEVLRGPQGTLFGRNALGGAINIISKRPTGTFGVEQEVTYGSYDQFRSLTHLNLPAMGALKVKGDFLYSRRDGWVKNPAPGFQDYNAYKRLGGRIAADLDLSDGLTLGYVFDISDDQSTMGYLERVTPNDQTPAPIEPDRVKRAQVPAPIDFSRTKTSGHALTLTWEASPAFILKSITAYRKMDYQTRDFFANIYLYIPTSAKMALSGVGSPQEDRQHQFSQELQATGDVDGTAIGRISYAAGLYYFAERVDSSYQLTTAAYSYGPGGITDPFSAILIAPNVLLLDPASHSIIRSKSYAGYAQASIRPARPG